MLLYVINWASVHNYATIRENWIPHYCGFTVTTELAFSSLFLSCLVCLSPCFSSSSSSLTGIACGVAAVYCGTLRVPFCKTLVLHWLSVSHTPLHLSKSPLRFLHLMPPDFTAWRSPATYRRLRRCIVSRKSRLFLNAWGVVVGNSIAGHLTFMFNSACYRTAEVSTVH